MSHADPQKIDGGHFIDDKQGRRVLSAMEPLEIGDIISIRDEGHFRVQAVVESSDIHDNQREFAWHEGGQPGREARYYYVEAIVRLSRGAD